MLFFLNFFGKLIIKDIWFFLGSGVVKGVKSLDRIKNSFKNFED